MEKTLSPKNPEKLIQIEPLVHFCFISECFPKNECSNAYATDSIKVHYFRSSTSFLLKTFPIDSLSFLFSRQLQALFYLVRFFSNRILKNSFAATKKCVGVWSTEYCLKYLQIFYWFFAKNETSRTFRAKFSVFKAVPSAVLSGPVFAKWIFEK